MARLGRTVKRPSANRPLERIHGSANVFDRQTGAFAYHGVSAIGAHDQDRANFYRTGGSSPSNARDPAILFYEARDLSPHSQVERGIAAPLLNFTRPPIVQGALGTRLEPRVSVTALEKNCVCAS
jgi:hypothetical protein